jgi:hypothetical protein
MIRVSTIIALSLALSAFASGARADTELEVGPSIVLTNQVPDGELTAKTKLVRLGNGTLVVAYGDAGTTENVYDVKARAERPARDIFTTSCNANNSATSPAQRARLLRRQRGRDPRKARCPSMETRTSPISSATARRW